MTPPEPFVWENETQQKLRCTNCNELLRVSEMDIHLSNCNAN